MFPKMTCSSCLCKSKTFYSDIQVKHLMEVLACNNTITSIYTYTVWRVSVHQFSKYILHIKHDLHLQTIFITLDYLETSGLAVHSRLSCDAKWPRSADMYNKFKSLRHWYIPYLKLAITMHIIMPELAVTLHFIMPSLKITCTVYIDNLAITYTTANSNDSQPMIQWLPARV